MSEYSCWMVINAPPVELGLTASGAPRKRRLGGGRRRRLSDEERRKHILESKRKWWRCNRGVKSTYGIRKGIATYHNHQRLNMRASDEYISMSRDTKYMHSRYSIGAAYYGEGYFPLHIPPDMPEIYRSLMMAVDLSVISDAALTELKAATMMAWVPLRDDGCVLRRTGDNDLRGMRPTEREALSELTAGLRMLKAEFRRRRLGAKWLAGRALQLRCTEDARPCNSEQSRAAYSVENP